MRQLLLVVRSRERHRRSPGWRSHRGRRRRACVCYGGVCQSTPDPAGAWQTTCARELVVDALRMALRRRRPEPTRVARTAAPSCGQRSCSASRVRGGSGASRAVLRSCCGRGLRL